MRSDIRDIEIQLLKPADIYSWIVIFGHKRPKEPIFPPSEYIYVKQASLRAIRCLYPVNLWLGWGHHGLAIFYIVLPVFLFMLINSLRNSK